MRLIDAAKLVKDSTIDFKVFSESETPQYAILSHRWGNEEITLQDVTDVNAFWANGTYKKKGYLKIQKAAHIAVDFRYKWLWCDTCCIDKTSSAELSEAINSMYRWYKESNLCLAYLADFPTPEVTTFMQSEWFERAWTLQELIAPTKLVFFDKDWMMMQNKHELAEALAERTLIAKEALTGEIRLQKFTVAQRMSWAAGRKATRVEDVAYSLLGIFDVSMPMLYGEGKKAFIRLQEEIIGRDADQSVFVWASPSSSPTRNLFAATPASFEHSVGVQHRVRKKRPFYVHNIGFDIELTLRPIALNTYLADLALEDVNSTRRASDRQVSLLLEIDSETGYLCRVGCLGGADQPARKRPIFSRLRKITILRLSTNRQIPHFNGLYGFKLAQACLPVRCINSWDSRGELDHGAWSLRPPPINLSRPPLDLQRPIFEIPSSHAISIAMLLLSYHDQKYLLQLTYDFDFNPCCCVSKVTNDPREAMQRSSPSGPRPEEKWPIEWAGLEDTHWDVSLRYQEMYWKDRTQQRCWVVKAVDHQEFKTVIPTTITKPYHGLELSFSWLAQDLEWHFAIVDSNQADEQTRIALESQDASHYPVLSSDEFFSR